MVLRRAADRPATGAGGVRLRHGLSFGAHYDPDRTSFGALVAHNEDTLAPGATYGAHDHHDVEVLSWVLEGAMRHVGPDGTEHVVGPGMLQVLAAGTGWHHDEGCAGADPVRLLQLWIAPAPDDPPPAPPALHHAAIPGGVVLAAGGPGAVLPLRRTGASLVVARLGAGEPFAPASASWRHVHVARGSVGGGGHLAGAGDTLEVTGEGPLDLVAGGDGADVLVVATTRS